MKRIAVALVLSVATLQPAELPVRQVVLYKHGVGYFERSGRLGPGESARLDFKASEMNDVLKSLTVEERGGGRITGLRYDSMDPLGRKLAEFPFRLADGQPLSAVFDQLKGARIELKFGGDTVAGAIVSGRLAPADEKRGEREQITLMLDGGDLRTFDLAAATGIRFTDTQLQDQFRDYLAALTASRSKEKRSVYIDSTDARARDVAASYMIPAAIWKSSYRLIFGESGQPVLEGWAIVDNTTGEDWTKVQLSLVSGRPISFVTQLYAPRYVNRPAGELPDLYAMAPVVYEGGYAEAAQGAQVAGGVMGGIAAPVPAAPAARPLMAQRMAKSAAAEALGDAVTPFQERAAANSTVAVETSARELGDLFEYRLSQPVTIRKNESAMLPFLQQKIDARKLLIFSQRGSEHPMNAAELTNSSGKTLDGGPITVYDSNAYAGEALMETLKASDKRLISYAVDLGTRVTEAFDSKQEVVREIHARRGVLTSKLAAEEVRTYTIRNVDQKAKTLIIEHPLRPQYALLNQKPVEKTSSAYRFEVKLAAAATEKFPVSEERVYETTVAVTNLTPDVILTYVRNKNLTDAGRKQLEQIADRKNRAVQISQALQDAEAQIRNVSADEDRVRRNISSLNQISGQQQQVQTYAKQLAGMETQLAQLRDRQADLQKQRSAVDEEIAKLVLALNF
jgi:hypothetical protein